MKGRKILFAFIISAVTLTSGCANGTPKTEEAKSEQKTTEENAVVPIKPIRAKAIDDNPYMAEELTDRFGDIPKKVEKLLEVAALKAQAHQLYVTAVEQKGEVYTFIMYEKAKVHPERIPKLIEDFRGELTFKADGAQPCFIYEKKRRNLKEKQTDALEITKNVLNGLKGLIGGEKSGIIDPLSK